MYELDKLGPGRGYSAFVSFAGTPQQPRPLGRPLQRRIRTVGAPLGVIITLGTVAWLPTRERQRSDVAGLHQRPEVGDRRSDPARGRPAGKAVKKFAAQVVELAFVRDRIDRGLGGRQAFALQDQEVYAVTAARAAAPVLQSLAEYRAPGA